MDLNDINISYYKSADETLRVNFISYFEPEFHNIFYPVDIFRIVMQHGEFRRKMAATRARDSHKMTPTAFLPSHSEDPCIVVAVGDK